MIGIVNYGMGNVGSILNMLRRVGAQAMIANSSAELETADKLILPGVGAFDNAMKRLKDLRLVEFLHRKVIEDATPILGICLGVQLFGTGSEEGREPGLGWIKAECRRFTHTNLRVPHMGWNVVQPRHQDTLFGGELEAKARFYFVHSYYLVASDESEVLGTTTYGHPFVSAIQRRHIMGVQFHPEKSHKHGLQLMKNFVRYSG